MGFRVRPATTLAIVIGISLAFQIVAILSVPVTQNITLCTYSGLRFGVFGLCSETGCSRVGIGYSTDAIDNLDGFSLPSNARHSISKLLVVHPIAAGFTLILFLSSILLHWHGPSSSLKFLFFLLLWTFPSFLLTLLAFLVDLLLFVPHLDWAGWIMLAATVLIAISSIMLCILRRTVSSRKSAPKYGHFSNGADYELGPLNYEYGTVDGASEYKSKNDDESDEMQPFARENTTMNYEDSLNNTRDYENLNDIPQTEIYDTMRGQTKSSQSRDTYKSNDILAPLETAYRGYEPEVRSVPEPPMSNNLRPIPDPAIQEPAITPYPKDIMSVDFSGIPDVATPSAPYPMDDRFPPSPSKLTGPRPRPSKNTLNSPIFPSEMNHASDLIGQRHNDDIWECSNESEEPLAPPFPEESQPLVHELLAPEPEVERQLTYRTRIAQTLSALQQEAFSTDSLAGTSENLLGSKTRMIQEIDSDDEETTQNISQTDDELYQPSNQQRSVMMPDDSSSVYSTQPPSTSMTPTHTTFPRRQPSLLQRSVIPEGSTSYHDFGPQVITPSEYSIDQFPFPDPNDKRSTPAPSMSNVSLGSSNFTSVSQRGINPEYLRQHPEELVNQGSSQRLTQRRPVKDDKADLLISSNPDFSIGKKVGR
jgi:hypothetical protein